MVRWLRSSATALVLLLFVGASLCGRDADAQPSAASTEPTTEPATAPATAPSTAPASRPAATAPAAAVPPPFPLADVAAWDESTTGIIRAVESELASDPFPSRVAGDLPQVSQAISTQLDETLRVSRSNPSLEALRALEAGWNARADSLADWKRELARRGAQIEKDAQRLASLAATWQQMLAFARSPATAPADGASNGALDGAGGGPATRPAAPPEVAQRAEAILGSIARTRDAVERRRAQVLALQTRVGEEDARVADALAAVRAARGAAVGRLLSQDSSPIWSPEAGPRTGNELVARGQQSFAAQAAALRGYVAAHPAAFAAHAALLLLLLPVFYRMRRYIRAWTEEDTSLQRVALVFDTPVAAAALLALLASRWFYPQAPRLLWAAIVAAALVPTVVTLRRVLHRGLLPVLYALVVFYVADELRGVWAAQPMLARVLLMAEMLGGAAFLAWLVRSGRIAAALPGRGGRLAAAIRAAARVGLIVLVAAFFAAALGYVTLANLLGNATLGSARLALILYAATRVIDGLVMSALRSWPLVLLAAVRQHRNLFWSRTRRVFHWAAAAWWAVITLDMLSARAWVVESARWVLTTPLTVGAFSLSLGQVIAFVLTVWATFLVSRFVRFLLDEDVYPRLGLARGLPYAISTTLHYTILVIGFVAAVGMLGYDMTRFTILAGAFGVGLGFGLQNIFNNFISGLILLFERPIKVGDVVQIGDATGVVRRIGIRASFVRLPSGAEIIMPNGKLISDPVTNWTRTTRQRRIELTVSVAQGTDPGRVMDLWRGTAAADPRVAKDPPPRALLTGFGSALTFELHAWVTDFDEWVQTRSDLAVAINAALAAAGIAVR